MVSLSASPWRRILFALLKILVKSHSSESGRQGRPWRALRRGLEFPSEPLSTCSYVLRSGRALGMNSLRHLMIVTELSMDDEGHLHHMPCLSFSRRLLWWLSGVLKRPHTQRKTLAALSRLSAMMTNGRDKARPTDTGQLAGRSTEIRTKIIT